MLFIISLRHSKFLYQMHLTFEFYTFFFQLQTRFKKRRIDGILKEAIEDLEVFYKSNNISLIAVIILNAFAYYETVLRTFQKANEARRKRASVSIKIIFHNLLCCYPEKSPHIALNNRGGSKSYLKFVHEA